MIEVKNSSWVLSFVGSSKKTISFDTNSLDVKIDDLSVVHPGEFEKSGILLEVKEYSEKLFYSFTIDTKHLVIVPYDNFELKEEILSFFGDVDILVIVWSKEAAKIFESIEARMVVPYWEFKDTFLSTLGQHTEEVDSYKIKWEFSLDSTEFVNLK